jgi:hypothetical protein
VAQLTAVAEELGISEDDKDTLLGGVLMAAFFSVGAPSALIVSQIIGMQKHRVKGQVKKSQHLVAD